MRFILIDNDSGYIWGDSADLGGRIFTGSPIEFARALDERLGEHGLSYEVVSRSRLGINEIGYLVYSAPDAFPAIEDGQDQDTIDAVERECKYLTAIRRFRELG
jgi:hypothetical protein